MTSNISDDEYIKYDANDYIGLTHSPVPTSPIKQRVNIPQKNKHIGSRTLANTSGIKLTRRRVN
jgi:hypothetical protein